MNMQFIRRCIPYLRNKYLLVTIGFIVWLCFFDRNDILSQYTTHKRLVQLQKDKQYYLREIDNNRKDLNNLVSNKRNLEKYAREKYLMKRDNEDIFVFVKEEKEKK